MKLFVRRVGHSWCSNESDCHNIFESLHTIYNISYVLHRCILFSDNGDFIYIYYVESMFSLYTEIQMIQIYPITVITVSLIKIDVRKQTTLHAVTLFVHEASDLN